MWRSVVPTFSTKCGPIGPAQSAEPGNVEVWHPKYAIPVPGGFTVDLQATQGDFGNHGAVHGVGNGAARHVVFA